MNLNSIPCILEMSIYGKTQRFGMIDFLDNLAINSDFYIVTLGRGRASFYLRSNKGRLSSQGKKRKHYNILKKCF